MPNTGSLQNKILPLFKMHLQANPLNMTNLFGSLVFCSENEDEDDYDYDEEEEEEY
jgi:hypothetical protein